MGAKRSGPSESPSTALQEREEEGQPHSARLDRRAAGAGKGRRGCASFMAAVYESFKLRPPFETGTQGLSLPKPLPPFSGTTFPLSLKEKYWHTKMESCCFSALKSSKDRLNHSTFFLL